MRRRLVPLLAALLSLLVQVSAAQQAAPAAPGVAVVREEGTPDRTWTLEACLQRAWEASTQLTLTRLTAAVDQLRIAEARRAWLPRITVTGTVRDTNLNQAFEDPSGNVSQYFQSEVAYLKNFTASFDQPVYTGGRNNADLAAARIQSELTDLSAEKARHELGKLVVAAYVGILQSRADRSIQEATLARAEQSLLTARKKRELGRGIAMEILGEESFLAETRLGILRARQAEDASRRSLLLLLNLPPRSKGFAIADLNLPLAAVANPDSLVGYALTQRVELREKSRQLDYATEQLASMRATRKPSLSLTGSATDRSGSLTFRFLDPTSGNLSQSTQSFTSPFTWNVGLNLRVPLWHDASVSWNHQEEFYSADKRVETDNVVVEIFDRSKLRVPLQEARDALARIRREYEDLTLTIQDEVLAAVDGVELTLLESETNEYKLRFASEEHRIESRRFELGMSTISDLLEKRGRLVAAEIAVNRSRYGVFQALTSLAHRTGAPDVQTLLGEGGLVPITLSAAEAEPPQPPSPTEDLP